MIRFICFRALMIVLNNSRPTVAIHITDPISLLTDHQSAVRLYYYGLWIQLSRLTESVQ